jgi:glycosyltransferase involved in cell wall biosynthesis
MLDVVFVGKFIPLHGIETIVQAARLLQDRQVPARIELVGTGQTYAAMRAMATELSVRDDTLAWTDWIPFEQLGERLRRADVALGVFGGGGKAARVIPNKVYGSLACGVATVTMDSPAIRTLLTDGKDALLVPPDDSDALARAIERLIDPDLRQRIAASGFTVFRDAASLDALADALAPALAHVGRVNHLRNERTA